ncbi:hypothetical protein HMPREF9136_1784 [Prevotella dentalis DSM 3688]|uniref:Uncharacterized protein n=1 Tax=Prevotella dentalis (strain ATCC 49559 / DSM 3688 / JCM 13448 / NCTC 12043 / ES 2772) TaxID=908937 RepID=F9D4K6_PREDD|nr:hypothetical protein HMPREF9136_1784 [Prevotella dentalis DSM 3688]
MLAAGSGATMFLVYMAGRVADGTRSPWQGPDIWAVAGAKFLINHKKTTRCSVFCFFWLILQP